MLEVNFKPNSILQIKRNNDFDIMLEVNFKPNSIL